MQMTNPSTHNRADEIVKAAAAISSSLGQAVNNIVLTFDQAAGMQVIVVPTLLSFTRIPAHALI